MTREDYRPWLLALGGVTILRLVMAAILPLSPDEAYYWIWSVHLQPGYFDHPPMVAYWIRAGTSLIGTSELGVRLLGPLAAAAGSVLLWDAGEHLFPKRHAGLIAASLFNATLIAGVGSILMTPDTPLIFFTTAFMAAVARWISSRDHRWWLAVGAAAGAALLSKYTGLLFIVAIFLWLLTCIEGRMALRTIWPWAGMALALLIFAPDIAWNAANGWVSYFKQGGRVAQFDPARSAEFFGELIVSQFALATPLVFALVALGLWQLRRVRNNASSMLLWLTLLPAAVFVEHVISGRVEANWPAIIFAPACLAAATLSEPVMDKWLRPALGLGFAFTLLAYAQALAAPFPIPASADPSALQLSGWPDLFEPLAGPKPAFITSEDYTTLAELAWAGPPNIPIVGSGRRWHYLSLTSLLSSESGLDIAHNPNPDCPMPLGTSERKRGDAKVQTYYLCDEPAPTGAVLLPRP